MCSQSARDMRPMEAEAAAETMPLASPVLGSSGFLNGVSVVPGVTDGSLPSGSLPVAVAVLTTLPAVAPASIAE